MRDDLLRYYERELAYLRRAGAEFARKYPTVAARLDLEATKCEDPHVERLLEGLAFLAARVHLKIDDDLSEVSEALLNVIFPQYVRPIPSLSLVEFHLDPEQGSPESGVTIPRGSALHSRPVDGAPCRFRTCYDTTLWPVEIRQVSWTLPQQLKPPLRGGDAVAALRLELGCVGGASFSELEIDRLRLHLCAELGLASTAYEILLNNCTSVIIRELGGAPGKESVTLPPSAVLPVGFQETELLLPSPGRSFNLYALLQEYFAFPAKFLFLDLSELRCLRRRGFGESIEIIFLISQFELPERRDLLAGLDESSFRLGCTPIVNLFEKASEPVLLNQRWPEYPIVADARRRETTGIYSVNEVKPVRPGAAKPVRWKPFFALDHGRKPDEESIFWQIKRKARGMRADEGSDVYLSFVDLSSQTVDPAENAVTANLTCFNEDLPSRLPYGDTRNGDFTLTKNAPVSRIVALIKPTPPVHPPLGKPQLWRFISQLSLNYTSLLAGNGEALRELLRLNSFTDGMAMERQIGGIKTVSSEPCYARIESEHGLTFARGHRIEIEMDEDEFAGSGVFLFTSVLERFLGRFVSLNSFSTLAVRSRQRKELVKEWAPRAGAKVVL